MVLGWDWEADLVISMCWTIWKRGSSPEDQRAYIRMAKVLHSKQGQSHVDHIYVTMAVTRCWGGLQRNSGYKTILPVRRLANCYFFFNSCFILSKTKTFCEIGCENLQTILPHSFSFFLKHKKGCEKPSPNTCRTYQKNFIWKAEIPIHSLLNEDAVNLTQGPRC